MLRRTGFIIAVVTLGWMTTVGAQGLAATSQAPSSERRVALVIGNGGYGPSIGQLPNPTNDARDVAAALGAVGFEVALGIDLDRDQMRRAVIDFGRKLREGGVGLFYYAGHAVQVDGRNFMIPLGADLLIPDDAGPDLDGYVAVETVEVDEVLARMGIAHNRLNIVVLDACRDNPLVGTSRSLTRGLAQMRAPTGTFIAYATAPGRVAYDGERRNSPYTGSLLQALEVPGLRLEDLFKQVRVEVFQRTEGHQVPWDNSSVTGEFYFRPPPPPVAARPDAPATAAPRPSAIDLMVWNAIEDSPNPVDFQTFLNAYPDSPFAPFARHRLEALEETPGPTASASRGEVASGRRAAEGIATAGPATPEARSGTDTTQGMVALPLAPAPPPTVAALPEPAAGPTMAPAPEPEPAAGPTVASAPAAATGPSVVPPAAPSAAPTVDPAATEAAIGLDREQRREVQFALMELGHDPRGLDGVLGAYSRAAIRDWQSAAGEEATGYLTEAQLASLLGAVGTMRERAREQLAPRQVLRDCASCPEMVVIPAGTFRMGAAPHEPGGRAAEGPQHPVTIPRAFAIGKHEVTFEEWDACVDGGGCNGYRPANPKRSGRGRRPVVNVSWEDAQAYVDWLSDRTRQRYRLPSEAEWEYAARAGTTTPFSTGQTIDASQANYGGRKGRTTEVGSYPANPWGLDDVHGNIWEWVEDCWNEGYQGAPADGRAWTSGDCGRRILRGGSWGDDPSNLRSANRSRSAPDGRYNGIGFRVAKTL